MIVVTGANGRLGRAVVDRLLGRVPAAEVAVSVRDPEQAADLAERGVQVRRGDFADPAGLAAAFEGATRVLVVSANVTGGDAVRLHRDAFAAAARAGAQRVLYTSHAGANPSSPFPPMPDHAATEALLADAGVAWTSLRNGFYASTVPMLLARALHTGELRVPADGPVAWTTHEDLADVAALALTGDDLDGPTPPLTGPEALTMDEVAARCGELTGHALRVTRVSDEQYRDDLLAAGLPPGAAAMLVGMFAASRDGDFAAVDPTLPRLLGRPATALDGTLSGGSLGAASPAETRR